MAHPHGAFGPTGMLVSAEGHFHDEERMSRALYQHDAAMDSMDVAKADGDSRKRSRLSDSEMPHSDAVPDAGLQRPDPAGAPSWFLHHMRGMEERIMFRMQLSEERVRVLLFNSLADRPESLIRMLKDDRGNLPASPPRSLLEFSYLDHTRANRLLQFYGLPFPGTLADKLHVLAEHLGIVLVK